MFFLYNLLNPADALQHGRPFARFYNVSSATSVDRDHGSGDKPCYVLEHSGCFACGYRIGEARHPGPSVDPDHLLNVGISNPGGLRNKEDMILEMGPGIWTVSETHHSAVTMKSSARAFKSGGNKLQRSIRPHFSHPAPLRQGSAWAGKWTGVCTLSDWPSTEISLQWPHEHWATGRVLLTRHWVGSLPLTIGGFYGYAKGPTWPKARQQSDALLETFTQQIVMGMDGVRIICGDFNHDPGELVQHQLWQRYGWKNAQQLAEVMFQHTIQPTCKGATERDQIWLSPEAQLLFRGICLTEQFADHQTVHAQLHVPKVEQWVHKWPRPAQLPWDELNLDTWAPSCPCDINESDDATTFLKDWASSYEDSISNLYMEQHDRPLPGRCRGRAQRLSPVGQLQAPVTCKPSRAGEVCLQGSLVGKAVRNWFKQLRRLQSLCHAVGANKQTPAAIQYRTSLWTAIIQSKGFYPNFVEWWPTREAPCDGAPLTWPQIMPTDSDSVQLLYLDFLHNFRKFENWHLAQRNASLKTKYEGSLSSIFLDLRDAPKPSVDHLWKEIKYQVLAIEEGTCQIMLDGDIFQKFDSVWSHNGDSIAVSQIDGALCTVGSVDNIEIEDEIVQRIFISNVNDVLEAFSDHWKPRWNLFTTLPDEMWDRITKFTQAHLPTVDFQLPCIDVAMWRHAIRRFKPHAARGPDGLSRIDLRNMPESFVEALLNMFHKIEQSDLAWPQQLRTGLVIATAKCNDAHEESQYRPITLFSMLFRAWAKMRTKHLLLQLEKVMPAEALGFLPHRETTEIWLLVQGQIETMLAMNEDYCGLCSDIKRAFNHIGRRQIFHMCAHLGFPPELLQAWQKFLTTFQRSFEIQGCVGPMMQSDSGFPEGDPLSILAMLTVNWGYHIYMKHFVPGVHAFSFVDNLSLAANAAEHVIQGFFAMKTYHELFGLTLDEAKTYIWGLTTKSRKALATLGFTCFYDACELGAAMSYGAKLRNRFLKARGTGLDEKWKRLQRSWAPQAQKLCILPKVFWPKALHGSPACVVADNYLVTLRRAATKALKLNGAGANPMLRLSLYNNMQNDPGYYQLFHCIMTFRRIARKSPDLLQMWTTWRSLYQGAILPGPFTKLLLCLNQIGWSLLAPPQVQDHEQHMWNLLTVDGKTLSTLLEDAWIQHVAANVKHKTMQDLHGLDLFLTTFETDKMLPVERSLLSALQAGSFISASEHARYDPEKFKFCTQCHCEDDRLHWLSCPRFRSLRQSIAGWFEDNVELPHCVTHHLLVPRLAEMVSWRHALLQIEDRGPTFLFYPPNRAFQHVFTDGACQMPDHPLLRLASWGVLSATNRELVAVGHLHGITQTIDRAELQALVVATQWLQDTDICVWSDSLSNVHLAQQVQLHDEIPVGAENYDLLLLLQEALQMRIGCNTLFRWVPSHIHASLAMDPFEEWIFHWNGIIDGIVTHWNHSRPEHFLEQHAALERKLHWWMERLRQLRTFYFKVAESQLQSNASCQPDHQHIEIIEIDSDDEADAAHDLLSDQLPITWQVRCRQTPGKLPGRFVEAFLSWLCAAEQLEHRPVVISELELVFVFLCDDSFLFPFQIDGTTGWCLKRLDDLFQTPTVTMLLRPIQWTIQHLAQLFPSAIATTPPKPSVSLGVYMCFRGLRLCLPVELVSRARERLVRFTSGRSVRRASDLARPCP